MGWDGHWYTGVGWWEVRKVRTIPSCSGKAQWKLSKPSQLMFFQSTVYLLNPWPRMASHGSYGWHGTNPPEEIRTLHKQCDFLLKHLGLLGTWWALGCHAGVGCMVRVLGQSCQIKRSTALWWNQTDSRGMNRGFVEGYCVYSSCGGIELS